MAQVPPPPFWPSISATTIPVLLHLRHHALIEGGGTVLGTTRERFFGCWLGVSVPILIPSSATYTNVYSTIRRLLNHKVMIESGGRDTMVALAVAWNGLQDFHDSGTPWVEENHRDVVEMAGAILGRMQSPGYLDVLVVMEREQEQEANAAAAAA